MSAMAAGVLAFAGCSNDLDNIAPGENDALGFGEDVIEIGLTNNNADTRAARPIGSSAAANEVNYVKLLVYKVTEGQGGTKTYAKAGTVTIKDKATNILQWTAGPNDEAEAEDDTHEKSQTVKLEGLEANTTYEFVAYGFNNNSAAKPSFVTESENSLTQNASNVTAPEEIFAGKSNEVTTNKEGKFSNDVKIKMERQIAGLLGYFTNIPTKIDLNGTPTVVEKLVVYANAKSTGFTFVSNEDFNGTGTTGTKTALLTFTMKTIATNYQANATDQEDESYKFADFQTPATGTEVAGSTAPFADGYTAAEGLVLKEGSCFGACFVLPYDDHYESQTLTVVLEDGEGTPLKEMNVITDRKPTDGTINEYDIRRNNFYSIGRKLVTDGDNGPDDEDDKPGDEDPDDDDPIDVNATTEIMLLLNDSWDVLHNMGIGD